MSGGRYIELQVASHFSFLHGASSCEELFAQAALLRIEALPIVDRNSLAGVVRAREVAKTTGVRLIIGCRLERADGLSVLVYPMDRPAYARLCRLLSLGKKRGSKLRLGACRECVKGIFLDVLRRSHSICPRIAHPLAFIVLPETVARAGSAP
jgi:DNA polymerase III alpha subunit